MGRFINVDEPGIRLTYIHLDINLYCYCINNPVNNTDISGNVVMAVLKIIGKMLSGALMGIAITFLSDVIVSAIRKKWKLSTASDYAESALSSALDALIGGGVLFEIAKSLAANLITQIVNMINGAKFNIWSTFGAVLDGLLNYAISRFIKSKTTVVKIKNIIKERISTGVKSLIHYISNNLPAFSLTSFNISFFKEVIKRFIADIFEFTSTLALSIYYALMKLLSAVIFVPDSTPCYNT